jgi:hypothetical protein
LVEDEPGETVAGGSVERLEPPLDHQREESRDGEQDQREHHELGDGPSRPAHALGPHELVRSLFQLARNDGRAEEHPGHDREQDEGDQRQQSLVEEAARERLRELDASALTGDGHERRITLGPQAPVQTRVGERVAHRAPGEEQERAEHQQTDRQDEDLPAVLAPAEPDHLDASPPSIGRAGPGSAPAAGWPR